MGSSVCEAVSVCVRSGGYTCEAVCISWRIYGYVRVCMNELACVWFTRAYMWGVRK